VGTVGAGESLGERALLTDQRHTARATAREPVEAAVLTRADLREIERMRPDIGLIIYRNLAAGLGRKLARANPG
jgi:CRP-like cAMP-binding protein